MYKFFISFCILFLMSATVFAQDFTFSTPPTSAKKQPPKLQVPPPRSTTSPADFKKQVKTLNQKTQNDLNQQAAQQFKLMQKSSTPTPATSTPENTTKPAKIIQTPATTQPQDETGTTTTPTAPSPIRPSDTSDLPPPPDFNQNTQQSNPEVYTGFPSASPNNTQQPQQQPQSNEGGWLNY